MIIKVQVARSSDGTMRMLAYDEGRTVSFEGPLDPDVGVLMAGRPKAFFYARVSAEKQLVIDRTAPWQSW